MGLYGLCRIDRARGQEIQYPLQLRGTLRSHGDEQRRRCPINSQSGDQERSTSRHSIGYLAHPDCEESGSLFEASAGAFKKLRWERSEGLRLDTTNPITIGDIAKGWDRVVDFSSSDHPKDMNEALQGLYTGKPAAS